MNQQSKGLGSGSNTVEGATRVDSMLTLSDVGDLQGPISESAETIQLL